MKQQIRLTESDLQMVIEGAVKSLLKEYGDKESTRNAMADAARKAIMKRGDDSVYHNAMNSLNKRNSTKKEFSQFQDRFEKGNIEEEEFNEQPANNVVGENKESLKITESQLFSIIKESVNMILKEYGNSQVGQYQLGRLAARKKANGDEEGYKNVVNKAKLQWGADRGVGTNKNAFGNGMHVGKDNVKQGYDLAKKGKL